MTRIGMVTPLIAVGIDTALPKTKKNKEVTEHE